MFAVKAVAASVALLLVSACTEATSILAYLASPADWSNGAIVNHCPTEPDLYIYASPSFDGFASPDTIQTDASANEAVDVEAKDADVPVYTVPNDNGIFPVPSGSTPLTVLTFAVTAIPLTETPWPAKICTKSAVVAFEALVALVALVAVPCNEPVIP